MAVVGEAVYKISYDPNTGELKKALNTTETQIEKTGGTSGQAFGSAWSVAAGSLIARGVSKIASTISGQLGDAIARSDTLTRFPKVMEMMGYSADDAAGAISKLRDGVAGIPTSLADVVTGTQRLASLTGDVNKAADWSLAISDAMLITTGSAEEASRGMTQFLQVLSRGKPQGQDWNTIMEVASPIMNELAKSMGYAGAELGGDFYTALQNGTLSMEQLMDAMVDLDKNGGKAGESLHNRVKASTGGIAASMTNLKQSVSNAIVSLISQIGSANIEGIIAGIRDGLVGLVNVLSGAITFTITNWPLIQPILIGITTFLGSLLAMNFGQKVIAFLTTTAGLITAHPVLAVISAVAAGASFIISNWSGITQFFGEVFQGIGDIVSGAWNGIVNGAKWAWDGITGIFGNLAAFFGSVFSTAWEGVKKIFSTGGKIFDGIKDGIVNAFKAIVNGIIGGINRVVAIPFNAINGMLSGLRGIDILGIKPFGWLPSIGVPQIPRLATGGIVPDTNGGRMIIAGDGGEDEWVVPESKMASLIDQINARGAGGNITINVSGTFATSTSEQRKVAEVIAERLQEIQKSRLNGGAIL